MSALAQEKHLAIVLAGAYVADVERTRNGILRLTYQHHYTGTTPLSLSLPPGTGTFTGQQVETYLSGLLPENSGVLESLRRTHGANPRDPLSLLTAIGKDCAGAVQLCRADELDRVLADDEQFEHATDSDIECRLAAMRMNESAAWTMPDEHWSLGGTQDKLTLRREHDQWFWASGAAPTTHIVKPGGRTVRAHALIEHVTMRAAAILGLDVAPTQFVDFHSEGPLSLSGSTAPAHQEAG